jgi:hypothetical protein
MAAMIPNTLDGSRPLGIICVAAFKSTRKERVPGWPGTVRVTRLPIPKLPVGRFEAIIPALLIQ